MVRVRVAQPRGRFIAFEGGEGTGKSTQARLLADALRQRNFNVVATREPGGTQGAEAIRKLLLHPPGEEWGSEAEALLFAAARADHVEKLIRPALDKGAWVVCDRFIDSSRAYQGGAGGLGDDTIIALHRFGSGGLRPDLTILLDVHESVAEARLTAREGTKKDAIGGRERGYHRRVARTFTRFATESPETWVVIDADASVEEVHARVVEALSSLLFETGA